jgi:hypothetical protein
LLYCTISQKVIVRASSSVYLLKPEIDEAKKLKFVKEGEINLFNDDKILKLEQGILYINSKNSVRRVVIDDSI